ncbi:hypothetical protein FQZ97_1007920 [compost metagenome]
MQHDARLGHAGLLRRGELLAHHRHAAVKAVEARDVGFGNIGQRLRARAVAHGHGAGPALAFEGKDGALRQRQLRAHQTQQVLGHGVPVRQAQARQQRHHLRQGHGDG